MRGTAAESQRKWGGEHEEEDAGGGVGKGAYLRAIVLGSLGAGWGAPVLAAAVETTPMAEASRGRKQGSAPLSRHRLARDCFYAPEESAE